MPLSDHELRALQRAADDGLRLARKSERLLGPRPLKDANAALNRHRAFEQKIGGSAVAAAAKATPLVSVGVRAEGLKGFQAMAEGIGLRPLGLAYEQLGRSVTATALANGAVASILRSADTTAVVRSAASAAFGPSKPLDPMIAASFEGVIQRHFRPFEGLARPAFAAIEKMGATAGVISSLTKGLGPQPNALGSLTKFAWPEPPVMATITTMLGPQPDVVARFTTGLDLARLVQGIGLTNADIFRAATATFDRLWPDTRALFEQLSRHGREVAIALVRAALHAIDPVITFCLRSVWLRLTQAAASTDPGVRERCAREAAYWLTEAVGCLAYRLPNLAAGYARRRDSRATRTRFRGIERGRDCGRPLFAIAVARGADEDEAEVKVRSFLAVHVEAQAIKHHRQPATPERVAALADRLLLALVPVFA